MDEERGIEDYEACQRHLEAAWQAALRWTGCVECARLHIAQMARLMARAKAREIIDADAPDDLEELETYEPPVIGADGLARHCKKCTEPPPPDRIRFFTHGTDEFL